MKENHMKGLLTEIWARLMLPTSLKSSRWAGNMSTAISRLMSTPTGHLYPDGVWLEFFLHHLLDFFVVLSNFVFLFFSQYCLRMVWPSGEIWTWGFLGIPGLEIITPASPCHIWMHVPHRACTQSFFSPSGSKMSPPVSGETPQERKFHVVWENKDTTRLSNLGQEVGLSPLVDPMVKKLLQCRRLGFEA